MTGGNKMFILKLKYNNKLERELLCDTEIEGIRLGNFLTQSEPLNYNNYELIPVTEKMYNL